MTWKQSVLEARRSRMKLIADLHQSGTSVGTLATTFSVTKTHVYRILKYLGVEATPSSRWIPEIEKDSLVAMYASGKTFRQIQAETGRDFGAIRRIVHASGFDVASQSSANKSRGLSKYTVNDSYFNKIDTEKKAWLLGFISSDGNIYKGSMAIGLAWKDREVLEVIKKELEYTGPVRRVKTKYRGEDYFMAMLNIASPIMVKDLLRNGVMPNKSLIIKPWQGPPELMPHFWRGMIDGDGSLSSGRIHLCGNPEIVAAFTCYCNNVCGTEKKPYTKRPKCWSVQYGVRHHAVQLVTHFYSKATISLPRKWELAKQIMAGSSSLQDHCH